MTKKIWLLSILFLTACAQIKTPSPAPSPAKVCPALVCPGGGQRNQTDCSCPAACPGQECGKQTRNDCPCYHVDPIPVIETSIAIEPISVIVPNPVPVVQCMVVATCEKGKFWNSTLCGCQAEANSSCQNFCPANQKQDYTTCKCFCVQNMMCIKGFTWDSTTCSCKNSTLPEPCPVPGQECTNRTRTDCPCYFVDPPFRPICDPIPCSSGTVWNSTQCKCVNKTQPIKKCSNTCTGNEIQDNSTCQCSCPEKAYCDQGYFWFQMSCMCELNQIYCTADMCPNGKARNWDCSCSNKPPPLPICDKNLPPCFNKTNRDPQTCKCYRQCASDLCPNGKPRNPIYCSCPDVCPSQNCRNMTRKDCPCWMCDALPCVNGSKWNTLSCKCENQTVPVPIPIPKCPNNCSKNQKQDNTTCKCSCATMVTCKKGYLWNSETCSCILQTVIDQPEIYICDPLYCPNGLQWNSTLCMCITPTPIKCPSSNCPGGRRRDPVSCGCPCTKDLCPNGKGRNPLDCSCDTEQSSVICTTDMCPNGKSRNPVDCSCDAGESTVICPTDMCPNGKSRNPLNCSCDTGKCPNSDCPGGRRRDPVSCGCPCTKDLCPNGKGRNPLDCSCDAEQSTVICTTDMCPNGKSRNPVDCSCSNKCRQSCPITYKQNEQTCQCEKKAICFKLCGANHKLDKETCTCKCKDHCKKVTREFQDVCQCS